jgi:protocatechuate 3,4-dioxygenase beta subunit
MTYPLTPSQIEGPFYPVIYHLYESNNLIKNKQVKGDIIQIKGYVQNQNGQRLPGILIEIWQADAAGQYQHPKSQGVSEPLDPNFLYWGRCLTDENGCYVFTTVFPGSYNDEGDIRTPHIHFNLYRLRNKLALTTQLYFAGQERNNTDIHLTNLTEEEQKLLLMDLQIKKDETSIKEGEFNFTLPV